jgi:hypothetical protein
LYSDLSDKLEQIWIELPKCSDFIQWTTIVFLIYEGKQEYNYEEMKKLLESKFKSWFYHFFFNFNENQLFFVDAMALRILWDVFGMDVFSFIEERETRIVNSLQEEIAPNVKKYGMKLKACFLKTFMLKDVSLDNIEDKKIEWNQLTSKYKYIFYFTTLFFMSHSQKCDIVFYVIFLKYINFL